MNAQKHDQEKLPLDLIDSVFARELFDIPSESPDDPLYGGTLLDLYHEVAELQIWLRNGTLTADQAMRVARFVCNFPRWGEPFKDLARVLAFGAKKYAPDNWRKGIPRVRVLAAALRHVSAAEEGEWLDEETGLPHLAHALCELMFLYRYVVDGLDLPDDRFVKQEPAKDFGLALDVGDVVRVRATGALAVIKHVGDGDTGLNAWTYELVARRPSDLPAGYVAAKAVFDLFENKGIKKGSVVWVCPATGSPGWKLWQCPLTSNSFAFCWFEPIK